MAVNGASPVSFVSEATNPGTQYFIPLSAIGMKNGAPDVGSWVTANKLSKDKDLISAVLASWFKLGLITDPSA